MHANKRIKFIFIQNAVTIQVYIHANSLLKVSFNQDGSRNLPTSKMQLFCSQLYTISVFDSKIDEQILNK